MISSSPSKRPLEPMVKFREIYCGLDWEIYHALLIVHNINVCVFDPEFNFVVKKEIMMERKF